VPFVDVDSAGGAALATRHLIERGRTTIATITGPQDMVAGIDRLTGYRQALQEARRRPVIEFGDFTLESGVAAMSRLIEHEPGLDAVFAASDLMASGAIQALRRAGRRVPDDVAVVGFDDVELAAHTDPPLTTVHQPIYEIGLELARQVVRIADGEEPQPRVILPTSLVFRRSS
jgi:DNA-binding LacI/PurR family transcriptional regulator